jgi:hypothetical protein
MAVVEPYVKSTHLEEGGGVGDIVADEALRGDADLVLLDGRRIVPRPLHPLVPVHLGRRRRRSPPGAFRWHGIREEEEEEGAAAGDGEVAAAGAKTLDGANDTVLGVHEIGSLFSWGEEK